MKTKSFFFVVVFSVALSVTGSDCINSPFIVAVNVDAVTAWFDVDPGDGTWDDFSDPIVIQDLIDQNFRDKIVGYRLYDIRVRVSDNYPDGQVSGSHVSYALDYGFGQGPFQAVITGFGGPSSSFKGNGVSLLNPGGLLTYDQPALDAFVNALNDLQNPPEAMILWSSGSGPTVPPGVQVCVDVFIQADGEVN